ncbi:hypothetical protein L1987_23041 [Smallanthus sonchifolius]|uniref:Uncharacterized protein n=1 Tax=Smallanthus sonchifolius TaxID=185202 RepID=A0ACB9IJ61_9ASTR|nr:hypothetical protein L1987_23041 [Smallanthus sonchifolius]
MIAAIFSILPSINRSLILKSIFSINQSFIHKSIFSHRGGNLPLVVVVCPREDMESQLDHERGPGKNKKKWNEKENEKLVASMLDVLNSGSNYKSDNGFKPGFINAVEQQLAILLPEAGIKAKPHIESRIKTMKSDWSVVHDMLSWNNTSGFGWDYNNNMLDAPQPVWQAYIQVHKNAAKWRGKKFPHYWDLCIVFGKDRANGRDAQTAADIISDINREETEANGDGLDDIDANQPLNNPLDAASREESSTQRKRKRRNSWDPLMNSLRESAEIIGAEIREATNTFNRVDEERKVGWVKNMLADTA